MLIKTLTIFLCIHGLQGAENDIDDNCKKPIVVGPCKAHIQSWAFDTGKSECVEFFYGGCQGNDNRFETKEDCESKCYPLCSRPKVTGPCLALFQRYWYNKATSKCELFTYGGCGSNGNNFETKQECEKTCCDKGKN